MLKFDENLFGTERFADLSKTERAELLNQLYKTLELRVGNRLAEELSDAQLTEFGGLTDDDKRLEWLEAAVPHFQQIVEAEAAALKQDLDRPRRQ